jgi:hypothetical protein
MAHETNVPPVLEMVDISVQSRRILVYFLCTCGGDVIADFDLRHKKYTLWHRRTDEEEASDNIQMKFMALDYAMKQGQSGFAAFVSQVHNGKPPGKLKRYRA